MPLHMSQEPYDIGIQLSGLETRIWLQRGGSRKDTGEILPRGWIYLMRYDAR
jgi:hypothetical protein